MSDLVDRIREALEGITAPPWVPYFTVHGDPYVLDSAGRFPQGTLATVAVGPEDYGRADCLLIAAAPSLLAESVAEIARLRGENERLREALREFHAFVVSELDPDPMPHVDQYLNWDAVRSGLLRASPDTEQSQ